MRRTFSQFNCHGYILLPVVMAIALIAMLAFVLNRTTGVNIKTVAARTEMVRARYVAEAGIEHGKWLLAASCQEGSLVDVPFQGHTYDVVLTQLTGNNYHIASTGTLDIGTNSTIEVNAACGAAGRRLYWAEWSSKGIWKSDLDGNYPAEIGYLSSQPIPLAVDPVSKLLFWQNSNTIRWSGLNGEGETDWTNCGGGECQAEGLVVDPGNKVYWTQFVNAKILRANLDGSVREIVVDTDIQKPIGIDLDLVASRMYWTDEHFDVIKSANFDGTGVSTVLSGLARPQLIEIDSAGGKMYYYEYTPRTISRANLDGTGIEILITFTGNVFIRDLALDTEEGKLYWTDSLNATIERANLDGSAIEEVIHQNNPWGIDIGPAY